MAPPRASEVGMGRDAEKAAVLDGDDDALCRIDATKSHTKIRSAAMTTATIGDAEDEVDEDDGEATRSVPRNSTRSIVAAEGDDGEEEGVVERGGNGEEGEVDDAGAPSLLPPSSLSPLKPK